MDYTSLIGAKTVDGSICQWLNDANVPATTILTEAQAFIYRRLRVRQMIVEAIGNLVIGTDSLTLPTDYVEERSFMLTPSATFGGAPPLGRRALEEVQSAYTYDATPTRINQQPTIYYTNATLLKFDSPPDQTYPYLFTYYGEPAALGVSNTTNFLTTRYSRLLRCACMAFGVEWTKDSGQGAYDRTYWLQMAQAEVQAVQTESDGEQTDVLAGPVYI